MSAHLTPPAPATPYRHAAEQNTVSNRCHHPIRWPMDNDLIDEVIPLTCPVVVGQGMRLFPVNGPDIALELVESRSTPKGVTIQVYRPSGRPRYETGTPTPST
jgi:hypothetical protein